MRLTKETSLTSGNWYGGARLSGTGMCKVCQRDRDPEHVEKWQHEVKAEGARYGTCCMEEEEEEEKVEWSDEEEE